MITLLKLPPEAELISDRNKTVHIKYPNNKVSFLGDTVNAKVCIDLWQDMSALRPSLVFRKKYNIDIRFIAVFVMYLNTDKCIVNIKEVLQAKYSEKIS